MKLIQNEITSMAVLEGKCLPSGDIDVLITSKNSGSRA